MKIDSAKFAQMQRERIYKTKPWLKSTGPKTVEGKDRSKMNALKTDCRVHEITKEFERFMSFQRELGQIVQLL